MPLLRRLRLPWLLCITVFTSAWLPLPLPRSLLPESVVLGGREFSLNADRLLLVWGKGVVEAHGLDLFDGGVRRLHAPRALLRLGLLPGGKGFLKARQLELDGPEILFDQASFAALMAGSPQQGRLQRDWPEVSFHVRGGRLQWTLVSGMKLEWELEDLRGNAGPNGGDIALAGRMLSPVQSEVRMKATARQSFQSWQILLEGGAPAGELTWSPQVIPQLRGLEIVPGRHDFRLAAEQAMGGDIRSSLELNLEEARVTVQEPPVVLSDLSLTAFGGLQEGLIARFSGTINDDIRISADGQLQLPAKSEAWARIRGRTNLVAVDQDRLDWVRHLNPGTADILEALELRGGPEARFCLDWQPGRRLGWAVHADATDMTGRYRGLLTKEGTKPAFPYPLTRLTGDFIATQHLLLIDASGRAGPGTVRGLGAIELRKDTGGIYLDIEADGVPIDRQVAAAAAGTPELASLWRDLGLPKGGYADVNIRLRADDARHHIGIEISGSARGAQMRPVFLPIVAQVEEVEFSWTPGRAWFKGWVHALGGRIELSGGFREAIAPGQTLPSKFPTLHAVLRGYDLAPSRPDRRILQRTLELPEALAMAVPSGPSLLKLDYLQPGTTESPHMTVAIENRGGRLGVDWIPLLAFHDVQSDFSLVSAHDIEVAVVPRATGRFRGQLARASFTNGISDQEDGFLVEAEQFHTPAEISATFLALFGLNPGLPGMQVEAWSDLLLDWRSDADNPLFVRLRLDPLVLEAEGTEPLQLRGEVTVAEGTVRAPDFSIEQAGGRIDVHDMVFHFGQDQQSMVAVLDSEQGIHLSPQIYGLFGPGAVAALQRLGLEGVLRPRNLQLRYEKLGDQPPTFRCDQGELELKQVGAVGPPALTQGDARIRIEDFHWEEGVGVNGHLRVLDGSAWVSGVPVRQATGLITVTPRDITLTELQGSVLGGRIYSRGPLQDDGTWQEGRLRLGLEPNAPVEALLTFEDLNLGLMRDQFGLESQVSGRVQGWAKITSKSLSPLDYRGSGRLEIEHGRLTTVPVLENVWQLLGVDPPVFRRGWVDFHFQPDGRVRIDDLVLDHDLLDVQGSGWVAVDGTLKLKVTLKRVRFFLGLPITDLPLVNYFFDLLVEQEIYGPFDRLQLAPRSVRKILGRDIPHIPQPLWLPQQPRVAPGRSPVLPLDLPDKAPADPPRSQPGARPRGV